MAHLNQQVAFRNGVDRAQNIPLSGATLANVVSSPLVHSLIDGHSRKRFELRGPNERAVERVEGPNQRDGAMAEHHQTASGIRACQRTVGERHLYEPVFVLIASSEGRGNRVGPEDRQLMDERVRVLAIAVDKDSPVAHRADRAGADRGLDCLGRAPSLLGGREHLDA